MREALFDMERQGARALTSGNAAAFYRQCLTDDALMAVPGFVVDKRTFLEAIERDGPWLTFRIEDPRVISVYVDRDGSWKLAYHQQTPYPQS